MQKKCKVGDLICVTWVDHYRYKGKRPDEMLVQSWGKVDEVASDGIALVQNEVQIADDSIERIMDGQFVVGSTIIDIKILK